MWSPGGARNFSPCLGRSVADSSSPSGQFIFTTAEVGRLRVLRVFFDAGRRKACRPKGRLYMMSLEGDFSTAASRVLQSSRRCSRGGVFWLTREGQARRSFNRVTQLDCPALAHCGLKIGKARSHHKPVGTVKGKSRFGNGRNGNKGEQGGNLKRQRWRCSKRSPTVETQCEGPSHDKSRQKRNGAEHAALGEGLQEGVMCLPVRHIRQAEVVGVKA